MDPKIHQEALRASNPCQPSRPHPDQPLGTKIPSNRLLCLNLTRKQLNPQPRAKSAAISLLSNIRSRTRLRASLPFIRRILSSCKMKLMARRRRREITRFIRVSRTRVGRRTIVRPCKELLRFLSTNRVHPPENRAEINICNGNRNLLILVGMIAQEINQITKLSLAVQEFLRHQEHNLLILL